MRTVRSSVFTTMTALAVSVSVIAPAAQADGTPSGAPSAPNASASSTAARLERITAKLPSDWRARLSRTNSRLGITDSPVQQVLKSKLAHTGAPGRTAIDPTQYSCGPTKLDAYVDSLLSTVDADNLRVLSMLGALDLPSYEAILYGAPKNADYAVAAGYRTSLTNTFGIAQRFWDVRLDDVSLLGMHGTMLTDVDRVTRTVAFMYDISTAEATSIAQEIVSLVKADPALKNGDNPIFTLNAFAFSGEGDPDPQVRKLKDKMIFGDGILDALKALGLNNVGPRAVLGHEMAHHVQYEDHLFDSPLTGAEATRRTELMADAFGTYFTVHKKGLSLKPVQVLQVEESFYDVGDCQFDSDGHHGTPNQRRAASSWGAATVAYSNNPNKVMPSLKLANKFDAALPELVKPDAPTSVSAYKSMVAQP